MEINNNTNLYKLFMESNPVASKQQLEDAQKLASEVKNESGSAGETVTLSKEGLDLSSGVITPNTAGGTTLPSWPPKKANQ